MAKLTRRSFVRGATAAVAGVAVAGMDAAAYAEEDSFAGDAPAGALTPGVYADKEPGFRFPVSVTVEVDGSSILGVTISSEEHPPLVAQAVASILPQRIVDAQSFNVDGVAGATFTSMAVKTAVERCIAKAGGEGMFAEAPAASEATAEDVETDVLVIGGGSAGCMAAYAASASHQAGYVSGVVVDEDEMAAAEEAPAEALKVMLVEKLDFIGGSSALSAGGINVAVPIDAEPTPEYLDAMVAHYQQWNDLPVNRGMFKHLFSTSGSTILDLQTQGFGVATGPAYTPSDSSFCMMMPSMNSYEFPTLWSGYTYMNTMRNILRDSGVETRLHTAATELVVEDGAIVGAKVEGPEGAYTIRAKKVVLACGGISRNPELIERYAPKGMGSIPFCTAGATGDGILMGEQIGAQMIGDGFVGAFGPDFRHGTGTDYTGWAMGYTAKTLYVNAEGRRFIKEYPCEYPRVFDALCDQPEGVGFIVIDSDNEGAPIFAGSEFYGDMIQSADTIAELAELCGIDPAGLTETVEAYNAAYDSGDDEEFGQAHDDMAPVRTAPFYAAKINRVLLGSMAGFAVDADCRVLDADGDAFPNLFAAGELVHGGNVATRYLSGTSLAVAFYSGRVAGDTARAELLA